MAIDQQLVRPFSGLELLARQVVEGFITGLHKSPFHGFSVEFAEHRLYNTGESTRHIDWKLFGRTDKLFVKRYEEETNLRCQIILDDSSSMYFPPAAELAPGSFNKIGFSVHCAAALTELLRRQRDAVGLSVFSEDVELHTPSRSGQLHIRMIYHELEKILAAVSDRRKTFAIKALHQIADAVHRRSLVMIFSDMFESSEHTEDLFSALQHLRHNKHEVVLFHVTDKKRELDFEYEKRPYRFIDTETGEEVRANPAEVKENYIRSMQTFRKQLKLHAAQYRIDLVEADIHEGFNQVLMTYLQKRLRM